MADSASSSGLTPAASAVTSEWEERVASTDWWSVMAELDARRGDALSSADAASLADYTVADSPAWAADAALVDQLTERGLRPEGLRHTLIGIESVAAVSAGSAEVVLVDQRSSYALVDAEGQPVQQVEAGPERRWRISVRAVEAQAPDPGWRIEESEQVAQ